MKKIFIFVKFFKDELAHKVGNKLSKIEDFKEVRIKNSEIMITGYWASVMLAENFIVDVLEDIVGIEEEYEILAEYAADAEIKDSKKVKDDIVEEEHKIEETPDSWIVDDIYEILKEDGTIYYTENYIGENKDFPNWVFEVKDELMRLENINESLEEIIKVGEKEWVRTPQDKIEWDKLTEDEKALLSYSNDMGHWFDNIIDNEDLLNQFYDLANRFSIYNESFKDVKDIKEPFVEEEELFDKDEKVFDSKEIKDTKPERLEFIKRKLSSYNDDESYKGFLSISSHYGYEDALKKLKKYYIKYASKPNFDEDLFKQLIVNVITPFAKKTLKEVGEEIIWNNVSNRYGIAEYIFEDVIDEATFDEPNIEDEKVFDSKEIKDSYSDDVKLFLEKVSALCDVMDDITELCYRNNDLNNIPGYPEHWKSFDEETNAASNWRDEIKEYIEKIK